MKNAWESFMVFMVVLGGIVLAAALMIAVITFWNYIGLTP